ncbi:MAG: tetratricopeptide repeat protein, partial [Pseudomonadota bacterium]
FDVEAADYDSAERKLRRVLDAPDAIGEAVRSSVVLTLARVHMMQGRFDEAEPVILQAVADTVEDDEDSPQAVRSLSIAAMLFRQKGQVERALEYSERMIAIVRSNTDGDHWRTATYLAEHGRTLLANGQQGAGIDALREAQRILSQSFGPRNSHLSKVNRDLAQFGA